MGRGREGWACSHEGVAGQKVFREGWGGGRGKLTHLGWSWASTKVATAEAKKQRQATLRDQCVQASSIEKSTPPTGAPKAACTQRQGGWGVERGGCAMMRGGGLGVREKNGVGTGAQ